jgi:hypothetical protein
MLLVCPRCNASFTDRYHCPSCGIALVPSVMADEPSLPAKTGAKWQQTALGRGVVGLLLAQGLYYGLLQLGTALLLMTGMHTEQANQWWNTWAGWSSHMIILVVALIVGGMMAGAGRPRGYLSGAAIGFLNGALFIIVPKGAKILPEGVSDEELLDLLFYGQPAVQALIGALGGLAGTLIWRPMASVAVPPPTPAQLPSPLSQRLPTGPVQPVTTPFGGPIAWVRVAAGAVLALMGSSWANFILDYMIRASAGKLTLESTQHARFVTWEIAVLVLLLGSAAAGANCKNAMKQGLMVGVFTALGLLIFHVQLGTPSSIPAQALWLAVLRPRENLEEWGLGLVTVLSFATIVPLAILGGWFGGALLPPLYRPPGQKRLFMEI